MYIMTARVNAVYHPDTRESGSVRQAKLGGQMRRGTRRTVDAASAAETLSARHGCGAATKHHARLCNVRTYGVRIGCEVTQEPQGIGVGGVVVCRGTRLE